MQQALNQSAGRVGRQRAMAVDVHVGRKIRERRIMLGLTQHQAAEMIGVTYQQLHKYEKGINRIASGRLYVIARAMGVTVDQFFEGLDSPSAYEPARNQRMLLELARNFMSIPTQKHQEALCSMARALADHK